MRAITQAPAPTGCQARRPHAAALARLPRSLRAAALALTCLILPGCVVGFGPCLMLQPFKNTLTGHVHFRDYPAPDGVDNVPILAVEKTAYVYSPAQSLHCLPANDVQLVGVAEFPHDVIENSYVTVNGKLFSQVSDRQHTPFVMQVNSILPIHPAH
ncbi:MAG TPA: hypothetical protein VHV81_08210 [Steroidobacteraceae bacterium]|jgi:hypothetical protein|nr:hypothetical protein [Steroidobacteraceae bacterium]